MSGAHTKKHLERLALGTEKATKVCPKCGVEKPLESFSPRGKYRDSTQRYGYCRPCHSVYQRGINRVSLLKRYGLVPEQYQKMLEMQGGVCWVCGKPPKNIRLAVDHDHRTGRVRALVCFYCNRNRLGTNTPETAQRVLELVSSDFDGRSL